MFLGSFLLKVLGLFLPIDDRLILFVPNTGASYSGSPRDIYQYLLEQPEIYSSYKMVWAFNQPDDMKEEYGLKTVKLDSISYFLLTLRAKYWISDINVERGLNYKKKGTRFLNTWHGVAIKKIGNDDPKSARYDYSNIELLCVSGEHDKEVFKTALNATEESFLEVGMPRNDRLLLVSDEERQEIRHKLGIRTDQRVILYVPTWRDSKDNGSTYGLDIPADFGSWHQRLDDTVVLFRAHSRTTTLSGIVFDDNVIDCSSYPDLNDLLVAADILVSDYSSVIFDYSLLNKPYFCFGYDYENYRSERGWYVAPEELFPYGVLETEEELLAKIAHYDENYVAQFITSIREKYMTYTKGNATALCVTALFQQEEK